jgi:hypothetical protein
VVALTDLLTNAAVAPFRREGVAEPASVRPADDDQPVGDGWYDKKLDRMVRRLNRTPNGKITVGAFVGDFVSALFEVIGHALSGM